jgi:hypothetical protein
MSFIFHSYSIFTFIKKIDLMSFIFHSYSIFTFIKKIDLMCFIFHFYSIFTFQNWESYNFQSINLMMNIKFRSTVVEK